MFAERFVIIDQLVECLCQEASVTDVQTTRSGGTIAYVWVLVHFTIFILVVERIIYSQV